MFASLIVPHSGFLVPDWMFLKMVWRREVSGMAPKAPRELLGGNVPMGVLSREAEDEGPAVGCWEKLATWVELGTRTDG